MCMLMHPSIVTISGRFLFAPDFIAFTFFLVIIAKTAVAKARLNTSPSAVTKPRPLQSLQNSGVAEVQTVILGSSKWATYPFLALVFLPSSDGRICCLPRHIIAPRCSLLPFRGYVSLPTLYKSTGRASFSGATSGPYLAAKQTVVKEGAGNKKQDISKSAKSVKNTRNGEDDLVSERIGWWVAPW